jgi:hypothetical protein
MCQNRIEVGSSVGTRRLKSRDDASPRARLVSGKEYRDVRLKRTSRLLTNNYKDESDCYGSARQNTGVDPQAPAPTGPSAQQQQAAQQQAAQQAGKGRGQGGQCRVPQEVLLLPRLRAMREREQPSAPRWARSPAGASSGCQNRKLRSKLLSKQPRRNNKAQSQAQAQEKGATDTFKRAFSACMDSRGYSVQ